MIFEIVCESSDRSASFSLLNLSFSLLNLSVSLLVDLFCNLSKTVRRLSGKKSARGAALSTSASLLQMEDHGLRDRQMAVIESWSEAKD